MTDHVKEGISKRIPYLRVSAWRAETPEAEDDFNFSQKDHEPQVTY